MFWRNGICRDPPHRNTNEQLFFRFSAFLYTHLYRTITTTASWHRPVHCSAERPFCSASPQRLGAWLGPRAHASMSATTPIVTVHCAAQDMSLTVSIEHTLSCDRFLRFGYDNYIDWFLSSNIIAISSDVYTLCIGLLVYTGHYAYRQNNFIVGLTNVSPATSRPTLWNYTLCGQYPGAVPAAATVSLYCPYNLPPFRYVIVQFPITDHLTVCELEVIAPGT